MKKLILVFSVLILLVGCSEPKNEEVDVIPTPTPEMVDALTYVEVPEGFWEDGFLSNEFGYQKTLTNEDGIKVYVQIIKKTLLIPKYIPRGKVFVSGRDIYQYTFKESTDLIYDDVLKGTFAVPQLGDEVSQWETGDYYGIIFGPTSQHNISRFVGALQLPSEIDPSVDTEWKYVVSDNYRYYAFGNDEVVARVPNDLPDGFIISASYYPTFALILINYAPNGLNEKNCSANFASFEIYKNNGDTNDSPMKKYKVTDEWVILEPDNVKKLDDTCNAVSKEELNKVKDMIAKYKDTNLIEIVDK